MRCFSSCSRLEALITLITHRKSHIQVIIIAPLLTIQYIDFLKIFQLNLNALTPQVMPYPAITFRLVVDIFRVFTMDDTLMTPT
jgi:hypothetical protein